MARKTKQQALETRQHILDVALRLFSQQRRIIHLAGRNCKRGRCDEGAIYWHFKNKSDLFNEIWVLSKPTSTISKLSIGQNSPTIHCQLSEILVYILEATVTEKTQALDDGNHFP